MLIIIWLLGFVVSAFQMYRTAEYGWEVYALAFIIWPLNIPFWIIDILNFLYTKLIEPRLH